jgi:hypothetical protein
VTELGVTVTLMSEGGGEGGVGAGEEVELPPHPQSPNAAAIVSAMTTR